MKQNHSEVLEILTSAYRSQVRMIDKDLYLTQRTHHYKETQVAVETYGPNWLFIFADLKKNRIFIRDQNQKKIALRNKVAILIPPFNIVEWHLFPGSLQWQALSSSLPLSNSRDSEISIFNLSEQILHIPMNWLDLNSFLSKCIPFITISNTRKKSKIANQVKNYIDNNFKEELQINKLSSIFKYDRSYLSREFKSNFNISMVEYRHQLRVYEALKLLNQNLTVTEAIFSSGFSSLNQFLSYFKKYFLTTPSKFHFKKTPSQKK
ncbi:MAG: AraC family transcriptional regulator [Bdellovibrionaceae bacterium]|nr:AraC family transcriptional regulator [Pseudobdellovibrionaceae bacterium]NUM57983.1 helix-turn-helix transcriptional regulator [Pseudobdellovibrionaceae bacterium]